MRYASRAAALTLLIITWSVPIPVTAQDTAASAPVTLTPAQMEEFLLRAEIVRTRDVGVGVTDSRRATLSDDVLTHDAKIQVVDQSRAIFRPPTGLPEINFKDSYRYNVAAYRLAVLLDLDNVPMSVERVVQGKRAAVTWWIDDVMMDEEARLKTKERGPDPQRTAMQNYIRLVFDELISNRDRNMGNLLWTTDWKMWMIDHTRAFRLGKDLRRPAVLIRIERSLFENMRALTADDAAAHETVADAVGNSLTRFEIEALIARCAAIVELFEAKIAERGELAILYTLPR